MFLLKHEPIHPHPFLPRCQTPPPPPYFGLTSPVYHHFFCCCSLHTDAHTHRQTEDTRIHIHLSLLFLNKQGHFNYLCLFWPSLGNLSPSLPSCCHLQENLLRLVHIEYSVKGKRDLLKAGRVSNPFALLLFSFFQPLNSRIYLDFSTERLPRDLN